MIDPQKEAAFFKKVWSSRIFNNIIACYGLDTKAVLDVGCSHGAHLACFGEGSEGITIIDEHIEYGRAQGLTIHKIDVESPSFTLPKQFDVVWANNFFEHMNCPHVFLRRASAFIKDDGVLILGVPVIPFFSFLTRFKKFRGAYASSHVNFFTRRTLMETVRYAGYDVIEARLFYIRSPLLDLPFLLIAPHMYVVARPKKDFAYSQKRLASLDNYEDEAQTGKMTAQ